MGKVERRMSGRFGWKVDKCGRRYSIGDGRRTRAKVLKWKARGREICGDFSTGRERERPRISPDT